MLLLKDGQRFYTYVPLRSRANPRLALEVAESLADEERYIRSSVLNNAFALCALVFIISAIAIVLGYWFVGRPMSHLTEKARRVGAGDLTGPLVLRQRDEIAEFAVEMNAMCDRLAEAHDRIGMETKERIAAIEQLRHAERLMTVGQLASGLAHELGTPLNVVLGRARMILAGDASAQECSDNARIIADQATKMTALIRQLLDFARPRGRPAFKLSISRGVAAQTVELLAPLAEKRRVKLGVTPGHDSMTVDADAAQIQQALTNLVVNAIQSMPNGGKIGLSLGARNVRPPADHPGKEQMYPYVEVMDEGAGIAPENLRRIFEPFFSTKDVGEGTGLGLSVTYGIIRDHGGWIHVNSTVGAGSTFTIYIPKERTQLAVSPATGRISLTPPEAGAKGTTLRQ